MRLLLVVPLIFVAVCASAQPPVAARSIVFAAHNPAAISRYQTNPAVVRSMVNRLVTAATNQTDIAAAWRSLVSPQDKVGIKISAIGGEIFTTHRDVVNAIVEGLAAAGHPASTIVVWDRTLGGASEAGYKAEAFRLLSIPPQAGYDPKTFVTAPVLGKLVWGDLEYLPRRTVPLQDEENTSDVSHFARILKEVTKVVNVPVLSESEMNGIAGCIYNMTVPNIDNWRRFTQGNPFAASSLADVYANPLIANKVVLNVMDGLIAEYAGGPEAHPNFQLHHATIYASRDPVAVDAVALRKIEEWRAQASLPTLKARAQYLQAAERLRLGNATMDKIELRAVSP